MYHGFNTTYLQYLSVKVKPVIGWLRWQHLATRSFPCLPPNYQEGWPVTSRLWGQERNILVFMQTYYCTVAATSRACARISRRLGIGTNKYLYHQPASSRTKVYSINLTKILDSRAVLYYMSPHQKYSTKILDLTRDMKSYMQLPV